MKPSAFDYVRVETIDEALSVLAEEAADVKLLAGGQSLLPLLNMRLAQPKVIVDINRLPGLDTLELRDTELEVGTLVRQRALEHFTQEEPRARLLHSALTYIGHPQTRNMGTVGGSLAHADPSAELPLLFTTLGGRVVLDSMRGERQVGAEDFFQAHFTTAIEADEMLTKIIWHLPAPNEGTAFQEFRRRRGDFALVAAACAIALNGDGSVRRVRLGIGGVADTPCLMEEARQLEDEHWSRERAGAIARSVAERFDLADDFQASASYRRQLATVAMTRVLEGAYEDALAKEAAHAEDQG